MKKENGFGKMVACPSCKNTKFRREIVKKRPPHTSITNPESNEEYAYVCTNCGYELSEEDYETLQEDYSAP